MTEATVQWPRARSVFVWQGMLGLLLLALVMIFDVVPAEVTMGSVQRLVYVHVAVAWCGLAGFVVTGISSGLYLWRRKLVFDQWAQATAEVGWLCTTMVLITGALWAREAWGTWWTWDPRLTTSLILWLLFAVYFLVRGGLEDRDRKARLSGVLALVGTVDVPLVIMATRWFRGMHPTAADMPGVMRLTLLASVVGFTVFFVYLVVRRQGQLRLADRLAAIEETLEQNRLEPDRSSAYPVAIPSRQARRAGGTVRGPGLSHRVG